MGHVGLMPQRINIKGKFISQGKSPAEMKKKLLQMLKVLSQQVLFPW